MRAQSAATNFWRDMEKSALPAITNGRTQAFASEYRLMRLADRDAFRAQLPRPGGPAARIALPLPEGGTAELWAKYDPVMAPGLAERYPEMRTYRLWSADGSTTGRMGWTPRGFHATLRLPTGVTYIDPYWSESTEYYTVYDVRSNINTEEWSSFRCDVSGDPISPDDVYPETAHHDHAGAARFGGPPVVQRKYRLAMAGTGEFTQFHGGTVSGAMAAMVTIVNRLNEVFEVDLAIRVELIANNDTLIFTDPADDPYINQTDEMLGDNPGVLNGRVGFDAYDIGHVISTGPSSGQGVASLRGVCGQNKGAATSTRNIPQGDPFTINILAHEMGHQFGANHTMSSCQNVNPGTAYEPGGGTTIMAYAGICPPGNNIQQNSDPYYHVSSIEEMLAYTRNGNGNSCAVRTDVGNTAPEVTISLEDGFYIPISTPFQLTAAATDMEDEGSLTYCWEQYNRQEGVETLPGSPTGNVPLFRSFLPTPSPTRVFPRINRIVTNTSDISEVLPTYSRDMDFRCTVRDNHPDAGAVVWDEVSFFSTSTAGPFRVTAPNTGNEQWRVGDYTEVTWDVANTDNELVNCRFVNIKLSIDGGFTYPITLLSQTPNIGSAFVTVPDISTGQARVRVEAADNIFFDISNNNFQIQPATEPGYTVSYGPLFQELCLPNVAQIDFATGSILGYDSLLSFEVTEGLPAGAVALFSPATVTPGESTQLTLDFTDASYDGPLTVVVRVYAPGLDTIDRSVYLELFDTDFSQLALLTPVQGQPGIGLSTTFDWNDAANALSYDFQLASSPAFGNTIIESEEGLTVSTYTPTVLFEPNTLYYWRIRPSNECGDAPWLEPFVFHTVNSVCQEVMASDVPVVIPGTGPPPTRQSQVLVPFSGVISDLNIPLVDVRYLSVNRLEVRLISPNNAQSVLIYDKHCGNTNRILIGFDDDAPNAILCPPDDGVVFRPTNPLSAFVGTATEGIWTLEVKATQSGGSAGAIQNWGIEFCADVTPQSPAILLNDTLFVQPAGSNPITRDLLLIEDPDNDPTQLQFTVVTPPAHGEILLAGNVLDAGGQFRQNSIDAGNLYYTHDGSNTQADRFTFVVQDGTGGFLPVETFEIRIDEDAMVNTDPIPDAGLSFRLFPNPAGDWARLQTSEPLETDLPVRIINAHGLLISSSVLAKGQSEWAINTTNYAAGVYFVQVGAHSRRLVIQR